MVGQEISHYKILHKLGEGGMGEVWLAEDTKLERRVALKFLASHLVSDPEIHRRFEREAKAAAGLSHSNICTVYEIDEADGKPFLAAEYIEGESLEAKIDQGPLKLNEAVEFGRQIAEGLQAAHEKGVVHRDIKPGNILATPAGQVKILDFGLALLTEGSKLTKLDTTVGTVAYMSPEQAQGAEVDHRTDIWALGCVLYEMVAGVRPFKGQYDQALLYEIVNEEPEPLTGIRAGVPMELEFIVGKCLAKDREDRHQSAKEIAVDLRTLAEKLKSGRSTILRTTNLTTGVPATMTASHTLTPAEALPADAVVMKRTSRRALQALAAVATLAFIGVTAVHFTEAPPSSPLTVEFSVSAPEGLGIRRISLSPDGRHLVMSVIPTGSLWIRPLDSVDWRELSGTDGASFPFWSPDSDEIGFFADGRLKKVSLAGGPSQTIAELARWDGGGSWSVDGTILFTPNRGEPIHSVPQSGGEPVAVTKSTEVESTSQRYPHFLPDGRHFLYVEDVAPERAGVYVGSLDSEPPRRLLADLSEAVYVPREPHAEGGFLLFVREGTLMAQPFDAARLELSGGAIALPVAPPLVTRFWVITTARKPEAYRFSASPSGILVYSTSGSASQRRLVWVDRAGTVIDRTDLVEGNLMHPRLSPDGGRVAYVATDGPNPDVWAYDLKLGTRTRLSNNPTSDVLPFWSPDGAQVAFTSEQEATKHDILVSPADGSSRPAVILSTEVSEGIRDWSLDDQFILYTQLNPGTGFDIGYLKRTGAGDGWEPHLFLSSNATEFLPRLSPDGRYIAYRSDESGRNEIYVRPFREGGRRTTVSTGGGDAPVWSRDGGELYYVDPDGTLVAVDVSTVGEFTINGVTRLFRDDSLAAQEVNYDVSLDRQRFLVTEPINDKGEPGAPTESTLRVIMNWPVKFASEQ